MSPADLDKRITHSRRVLAGWRLGGPTGPVEDTLAMIDTEIGLLEGWAVEQPEKAGKIGALVERWHELAARLQAKAN